jgi:Serine hydrolase (FSH1)
VEKVHEYLQSVIDEDGPYDGIVGFSEGAAIAASFLLSQEYEATFGQAGGGLDSEFKMAIFFNAVKPYSPSEEIGSDAAEQFQRELRRHSLFLKGQNAERRKSSVSEVENIALAERRQSVLAQRRESVIAWKNSGLSGRKASIASSARDEFDEKAPVQRWESLFTPVFSFDPGSFPCRIQIPTLNVIGTKDQFHEYSEEVTKLCDPGQMEVARIDMGHDIPRSGDGLAKVVERFEMVVMMASIGGG